MNWLGQRQGLARTRRHLDQILIAALVGYGLLSAPNAQATVTVGSPLSGPFFSTVTCGNAAGCTWANTSLGEAGANVTSPVTGEVVLWRIAGNYGGTFSLRILRPAGAGQYTGAGTGNPMTATGTATLPIAANLPIRAGDLIGIDYGNGHHLSDASVTGSAISEWAPRLADTDTGAPAPFTSDKELLFNADVVPQNTFSFAATQLNKRKGTATLNLTLPNPGELSGSGVGVIAASAGRAVTSKSVATGPAQLLIKAKGKKRRKLNETGKVKLNVAVTYTPTGGDPNTESLKVKLKKKL